MSTKHSIAARNLLAISFVLAMTDMAHAQAAPEAAASADTGGLADIVVTATRRATNVQDVPFAISAVGGDTLRDRNIVDPRQLSGLAPNLNVDQGIGNGATHVSIRGLASTDFSLGSSSPVATYIDDIYQPFQFGIGTQIFDLNRVEVLRGPQGTLFGKNTTGGALNYYSQTPAFRDEGYLTFDGGSGDFGHYSVEGAFNKQLASTLAVRASFRVDHRDDYVDNIVDGSKIGHYNNYNGRLQLAWKPTDETSVNLKLFGLKNKGDGPIYIGRFLSDPCVPSDANDVRPLYFCTTGVPVQDAQGSRKAASEVKTYENYHNYGAVLKIDQQLGEYTLTSITGAQKGVYRVATNDDGVAGDYFHSLQNSKTSQISQELRLATPVSQPLRAVIGLFGMYDKIRADQGSGSTENDPALGLDYVAGSLAVQKTTTAAAFGSVTYEFNPVFSIIGGARYSLERKKIDIEGSAINAFPNLRDLVTSDISYVNRAGYTLDPANKDASFPSNDRKTWKRFTWDITANAKPTERSLVYAKVATGFRSGGYPVGVTGPNLFVRLQPEKVTSYELGFKSQWFDRMLRVNGTLFWMDYKDMQVQTPNTVGVGLVLSNAGSARSKGAELEVELAPATGLLLSGSVGYTDAKYRQYDVQTGNRLPYAPEWTGNFAASYTVPVGDNHKVDLSTNWTYRSRLYFDPYQLLETSDPSRLVGNAQISFADADDAWTLSVYANNLTNRDMKAFAFTLGPVAPAIYAPKRTWGVKAGVRF